MKYTISIFLFSTLLAFAPATAHTETLIQVVVDHSGVLHDEQDSQGKSTFNKYLESFFDRMARQYRRDRDSTAIKIISAVEPPHIIWSGNATEFYRTGLKSPPMQGVIHDAPNGCNNLIVALDEVSVNARIADSVTATDDIVHIITSGVHSGPNCHDLKQSDYAQLVATLDTELSEALKRKSQEFSNLSIHFLTAPQRRALFEQFHKGETKIDLFTQGDQPPF